MFSIGNLSSSSSQPVYFDIRLKSPYKNMILIQGTPLEAAPIPLSGHLVFSIPEHLNAKKISLKLSGTFKLEFLQVGQHKNTSLASIVKEQKPIFECVWENLLVSSEGIITIGGGGCSGPGSAGQLADQHHHGLKPHMISSLSASSIGSIRKSKKSHSSLVLELPQNGVSGTPYKGQIAPAGTSFGLRAGNYELPFEVSLPPDIAETVEGLQAGSVLYKFESQLERGGFKNAFSRFKYLRIFRTLSVNNLAVQEEMYVGKSWPGKLQYEVSIPSRAIPIGGITPITIRLYPFKKGYRLHKIKAELVQYYAFQDQDGQLYDDETVVFQQEMFNFEGITGCDTRNGNVLIDKTEIISSIKLPDNLKKVTQDCDIGNDLIRVRHKLSIKISMKRARDVAEGANASAIAGSRPEQNTDIKANLPVLLYVSPHVLVNGRLVLVDNAGKLHFRSGGITPLFEDSQRPINVGSNDDDVQEPFSRTDSLNNLERMTDGTLSISYFPKQDMEAPPTYSKHVYDRLYDAARPPSEPGLASLARTASLDSHFPAPEAEPIGTRGGEIKRPQSSNVLNSMIPKTLSLNNLNEVPSYEQTVHETDNETGPSVDDLAPSYESSNPPSRVGSPIPALVGPKPSHINARSFRGGLKNFVRARSPEIRQYSTSSPLAHGSFSQLHGVPIDDTMQTSTTQNELNQEDED
ncbi:LAMI_0A03290g1_1 [Lachancea mirantina]|uniref:LAMI_0A03290g1_1 n=1 Tax=Lachancea mirantina TaxID=1230905 RepID=A0A1G4IMZ9_9SACH|nr:LAMI_0A03290g1_1 [Lachancea mirantina]